MHDEPSSHANGSTLLEHDGSNHDTNNHHHESVTDAPTATATTSALPEACALIHAKVHAFLTREPRDKRMAAVQRQTRISLDVIAEALERYDLPSLSFSYNGGKDCLVLLILYLTGLHLASVRPVRPLQLPPTLPSIYIEPANPFPSVTAFVTKSSAEYHLSLAKSARGANMREAFATYLSAQPSVQAIFVGTRRTDPHGAKLTHFDPTDGGWPAFVRVHPVIDWHYAEIWGFIRELGVEYCELYDRGYTSLGGTTDTLPNPALRKEGTTGEFRPAYELMEDEEERLGREK